jgi:hypothetical protein
VDFFVLRKDEKPQAFQSWSKAKKYIAPKAM